MDQIAFVTGADRGLGLALAVRLVEKGWRVLAGQYMPEWPELAALAERFPGRLTPVRLDVSSLESVRAAAQAVAECAGRVDLLINNAGVSSPTNRRPISEPQDYGEMHRLYDVNTLGPLRVVEAFLPLMESSSFKRLCFVSSEAGSINRCERRAWYGYCMSKAALNMGVHMLFNRLRPLGFTFRVYHPGWMRSFMGGVKNNKADIEPEEAAGPAVAYFTGTRAWDRHQPSRNDEDRLAMRDWRGREWPW